MRGGRDELLRDPGCASWHGAVLALALAVAGAAPFVACTRHDQEAGPSEQAERHDEEDAGRRGAPVAVGEAPELPAVGGEPASEGD